MGLGGSNDGEGDGVWVLQEAHVPETDRRWYHNVTHSMLLDCTL